MCRITFMTTGNLSTPPDIVWAGISIADQLVLILSWTRAQTQRSHNVTFKTKPTETWSLDIKTRKGSASLWFAEIHLYKHLFWWLGLSAGWSQNKFCSGLWSWRGLYPVTNTLRPSAGGLASVLLPLVFLISIKVTSPLAVCWWSVRKKWGSAQSFQTPRTTLPRNHQRFPDRIGPDASSTCRRTTRPDETDVFLFITSGGLIVWWSSEARRTRCTAQITIKNQSNYYNHNVTLITAHNYHRASVSEHLHGFHLLLKIIIIIIIKDIICSFVEVGKI